MDGMNIPISESFRNFLILLAAVMCFAVTASSQVPSPRSVLGFDPGDDRKIADWGQITDYFRRLDTASGRVTVREFGRSTKGNPMIAAFISSENNIKDLEQLRRANAKLADPRTVADENELETLLKSGKTIVAISCSIHSNEIVASQMSMELAHSMATATDDDTLEILENTILLLIPSPNPDGIDIVANWYRKTLGSKSEGTVPPELYHHYAGHDNNRDWFMLNLKETQAVTKLFWQEWFPQIVFDVHQMGQNGPRFVIPPFFDPPNPRIAPSLLRETGLIGYKMAADLQAKNIAGVATNSTFDTWWHGGFRTAPYYHNSIGILSEAASADLMTPVTITPEQLRATRPARGLSSPLDFTTSHPDPWQGGIWRPRDIAQIEITASRSLLQMAAKYRRHYLRNFYERGRENLLRDATIPRAFAIIAGQPRAAAISRLVEILRWQGIEVHEMTHELWVKHSPAEEFHEIPLGSFLIFTDQPQRRNVLSLFERQVYPDRKNAAGEAEAPYDVAGWTLPLQMGIETHDIWEFRDLDEYRDTVKLVTSTEQSKARLNLTHNGELFAKLANPLRNDPKIGLYKPYTSNMDEGWTRLVFDQFQIPFASLSPQDMRKGGFDRNVIVLATESETSIMNGLSRERYPDEFAGGIGAEGVENLKKFVENGGRLVCFDASCDLVIKRFELPIKNVLSGLNRAEFYNPGSIVGIDVNRSHFLGRGVPEKTAAYFRSSSAFEVTSAEKIQTIAKYAQKDALLSGWMLGEKYLNGKAAMVQANYGKGDIVLFAFRPQHRGQSWATFPLLFNAIDKR
jgi:hypothetical protein